MMQRRVSEKALFGGNQDSLISRFTNWRLDGRAQSMDQKSGFLALESSICKS